MPQPKFAIDIHADAADFLTAPINISASGNNTVIVGVPDKLVRVYMIWFLVSAANTIIFNDGITAFSGPADFTANEALVFDFCTKPWFVTSRGNDFAINLANAVQVGGMVYYTQDY